MASPKGPIKSPLDTCEKPDCGHRRECHDGSRMKGDPPTSCSVFGCPCGGFREPLVANSRQRRRQYREDLRRDT